MEIKNNKSSESLPIQHEKVVDNSFNYIAISPDGRLVATFNAESSTIKVYKVKNLATPTVISCDEIGKLGSSSVKVSYSLAISNVMRIGETDDALIAVSHFCDNKDMMKKMEDVDDDSTLNLKHQNPIDIAEKGEKRDNSKNDVLSTTFVISRNLKTLIKTKVKICGGIVKFLDNRSKKEILEDPKKVHFKGLEISEENGGLEKELYSEDSEKEDDEINQSNEITNLIVMNAYGITKLFIKHDPYVLKTAKEYDFPIIIQDKINHFYKDIPCTGLLQNSILSNYLFADDYRNKKVEMYNLKSLDLEIIFQKCNETPLSTSILENPILSISNYGHLLAHCSNEKNITIYLMENGLEIVTKEFRNANRILLVSFIDHDEKLFIVTEEENGLMINIWDIFTYKSDIRTRKVTGDTNILNSLQEDSCHSLAISNGTILAPPLHDGNIVSVLESSDVKGILNSSNQLTNLLSIQKQQNSLLEGYSEPWVNHEQHNYASYFDKSKTVQIIIGKTTVQVWRKKGHGFKTKQVLEYIWTNISNEKIEVISLEVGNWEFSLNLSLSSTNISNEKIEVISLEVGNWEFSLNLSLSSTNSADRPMPQTDQSQNIKIHWPNETHILKDACDAIKYLYERKYEVKQKNQIKYEKLVTGTEKIIKKCIKKNPDLWKLSEIRYEIVANFIQAKRILLLHHILFDCKKVDANDKTITKVSRYLHIPRQYSWPVKKKKSDLEIAIEESLDKHYEEKAIVAMLLEYYSNNAEENIGWMFTVTKAIPSLNKQHLGYLKELFYKPCFGIKEEYLNSKILSQNELKKGYNRNVYPLNIRLQLLEKQNSWWDIKNIMKKCKLSKIDNEKKNTYHETTTLRIVPLPDFTVYPENYQGSPFSKFLDNGNKILYDNPAIEACIEFKWRSSILAIILGCVLLVAGIVQLERKKNIYNIFNVISMIISVVVPILDAYSEFNVFHDSTDLLIIRVLNILKEFAILVLYFEFLLLLRMFSRIAIYINIVLNILKAVFPFMCIMLFLAIVFGFAMISLLTTFYIKDNEDGSKEYVANVTDYTTILQDFDLSNPITDFIYLFIGKWQLKRSDFWPIYLLSILASILLVVIMQNLLIAVMSNIYDDAKSNAKLVALKRRGELISDYKKTEKLFTKKENGSQRYIYYIGNSDYQGEWLKKAKKYRESHRSLLLEDISNRLLLTKNNESSDDESDDDSYGEKSNNELATKNVTSESDNVEEYDNNNVDEKYLKLQEEMKKMQNDIKEILKSAQNSL